MLSFMFGLVVGTLFGAGGLLTFSMAAIAADSDRMMPAIQPTPFRPTVVDNYVENYDVITLRSYSNQR